MLSNTGGLNGPVSTGKKKRLQFLLEIVTVSKNPCLQKTSRPISVLQKLGGHIHHDRHPLLCRDKTAGILWCAKPFLKKFLVHSKAMGVCWLQYVGAQSGNVQEPNLCVCTSDALCNNPVQGLAEILIDISEELQPDGPKSEGAPFQSPKQTCVGEK